VAQGRQGAAQCDSWKGCGRQRSLPILSVTLIWGGPWNMKKTGKPVNGTQIEFRSLLNKRGSAGHSNSRPVLF
jgi:hypothetical protein